METLGPENNEAFVEGQKTAKQMTLRTHGVGWRLPEEHLTMFELSEVYAKEISCNVAFKTSWYNWILGYSGYII